MKITREWRKVVHLERDTEVAVGQCECGHLLELQKFRNTCVCGRDYNLEGKELPTRPVIDARYARLLAAAERHPLLVFRAVVVLLKRDEGGLGANGTELLSLLYEPTEAAAVALGVHRKPGGHVNPMEIGRVRVKDPNAFAHAVVASGFAAAVKAWRQRHTVNEAPVSEVHGSSKG